MDERHQVVQVPQPVPVGERGFLGSVSSIYINGVKVQSQRVIQHTGSAELTIEGKNLKDTLRLLHDSTEYTPLTSTEDSVTFILGDNGTNRIYVNGEYSFGVQISGIVVPEGLPSHMFMYRTAQTSTATGSQTPLIAFNNSTNCLQVAEPYSSDLPNYIFKVDIADLTDEDFALENCVMNAWNYETNVRFRCNLSVQDPTKLAYIAYQDFIVAVFNYE